MFCCVVRVIRRGCDFIAQAGGGLRGMGDAGGMVGGGFGWDWVQYVVSMWDCRVQYIVSILSVCWSILVDGLEYLGSMRGAGLLDVVEVVALVDFLLDLEVLRYVEFEEYVVFGFGAVVVEPSEALQFVVAFSHEYGRVHVALW